MLHNNDKNLIFRKAANNNDIKTLISLKNHVDINSAGQDSKQTAAHRAASAGNIETLQLLFNWSADFNLVDKDGKKPCNLAKNDETKLLFRLIEEGHTVLQVRKSIFNKTDYESTPEEKEIHSKHWNKLNNTVQKSSADIMNFYKIYEDEASKKQPTQDERSNFSIFKDKFQICYKQLDNIITKYTTLKMSIDNEDYIASCGQVTASSYAWLVYHKQVGFHVEEINFILESIQAGHALLVFNRDNKKELKDYNGWKNSLIVDPYYNRIFFFNFREQYQKDSCVKEIETFKLLIGASNKPLAFPTEIDLPKTKKAFDDTFASVNQKITSLIRPFHPELEPVESKKNSL